MLVFCVIILSKFYTIRKILNEPKVALEKREQMIREGYCVIENILIEEFLLELHDESERHIAEHKQSENAKYHRHYIHVKSDDMSKVMKMTLFRNCWSCNPRENH